MKTTKVFADLVMKANYPFTEVESEYVQNAIKQYDENAVFPSRATVRREVSKQLATADEDYLSQRIPLLQKQKNIMFAVGNDCTTSAAHNNYCSLAASVMNTTSKTGKWEIIDLKLGVDYFPPPHTQETTIKQLLEAIKKHVPVLEAPIEKHLSYGVFDCATNTPRVPLLDTYDVGSVHCLGHRLNTTQGHIQAIPELASVRNNIDVIFKIVKGSGHNLLLLENNQKAHNRKRVKPKFGAATRFVYDTQMFKRSVVLYPDLSEMTDNYRKEMLKVKKERDHTKILSFSNKSQMEEWMLAMKEWSLSGQYMSQYLVPYYERIEFWVIFV